jgi:hypothetical protein
MSDNEPIFHHDQQRDDQLSDAQQPDNQQPQDDSQLGVDNQAQAPAYQPNSDDSVALTPADYQDAMRQFEEMSLAEVLGQFFRAPNATLRAFWLAIQPETPHRARSEWHDIHVQSIAPTQDSPDDWTQEPSHKATDEVADGQIDSVSSVDNDLPKARTWTNFIPLVCYIVALVLGILGGSILVFSAPIRTESRELVSGFPYFVLAIIIWLVGDAVVYRHDLREWWGKQSPARRVRWGIYIIPVLILLWGLRYFLDASDDPLRNADEIALVLGKVGQGAQILVLGVILWLLIIVIRWLLVYIAELSPERIPTWLLDRPTEAEAITEPRPQDLPWYMQIHPVRVFLMIFGMMLGAVTWLGSSGNNFSEIYWVPWLGSVVCVSWAFAPRSWWNPLNGLGKFWSRLANFQWTRYGWVVIMMVAIMALGAKFRLDNLNGNPADGTAIPQEMTSDHVEKLLDSQRVKDGNRNIFFANNGGREPFQMYAMALFSSLPGQGINYQSLKLLAVIESLITLPVMFWLGYECFGRDNKRLGIMVGLLMMAFVASSYWHVSVTRLALRIILTPLVASLLMIYLLRAMRDNQIGDYLKAGMVLGFGLYTYQATRMLPIVVLVGVGLAFVWGYRTRHNRLQVLGNLGALVLVAFMAFLPLYHYSIEAPDQFWRRTAGRILGDDVIQEKMPDGSIRPRIATFQERLDAFNQNVPILLNNLRNAVLMFNWKGDVAWINGVPNYPVLDRYSGGLFVLGVVAWGIYVVRRRDTSLMLVPLMLLIMLLPSALSIAFPIENPSLTRTSGALPATFLLVALPLALIIERVFALERGNWRIGASFVVCLVPIVGSFSLNYGLYMTKFAESYSVSSLPYSEAGRVLQGFAISDGSYGNAFLIGYPNWYDHRAVGLAGGIEGRWTNGVFDTNLGDEFPDWVDYLPNFMADAYDTVGLFRYDPNRDLLFFYSTEDVATSAKLKAWFPEGRELEVATYQTGKSFMTYRVPSLGEDGFLAFLAQNPVPR